MEFVRKRGFYLKTDPQIVGEVCHELEKQDRLTTGNLVEASRPKTAPLHNEFEWNNKIAAEKYREVQAGYIIRSVAIKVTELSSDTTNVNLSLTSEDSEVETRFFHAIDLDGEGFDSLETISAEADKTQKLLALCRKDLRSFKEKYEVLRSVLPDLFCSIDKTLKSEV